MRGGDLSNIQSVDNPPATTSMNPIAIATISKPTQLFNISWTNAAMIALMIVIVLFIMQFLVFLLVDLIHTPVSPAYYFPPGHKQDKLAKIDKVLIVVSHRCPPCVRNMHVYKHFHKLNKSAVYLLDVAGHDEVSEAIMEKYAVTQTPTIIGISTDTYDYTIYSGNSNVPDLATWSGLRATCQ